MESVPNGYRCYQYLYWLDTMEKHNSLDFFEGPPTVSNLIAHILKCRKYEYRKFSPDDVNFRYVRRNFDKCTSRYIEELDKVADLDSGNCLSVDGGRYYYKRSRTEPLITINQNGYRRLAYLYILKNRTHDVLDQYDVPSSYYSSGSISLPIKKMMRIRSSTERISIIAKSKRSELPTDAQEELDVEDKKVEKFSEKFSDEGVM